LLAPALAKHLGSGLTPTPVLVFKRCEQLLEAQFTLEPSREKGGSKDVAEAARVDAVWIARYGPALGLCSPLPLFRRPGSYRAGIKTAGCFIAGDSGTRLPTRRTSA